MSGRFGRVPALLRRERGVSYSLPLVMVAPVYLVTVLGVVEVGLLILARIGVGYAAHAAARSAVVWDWADPSGTHPRMVAWAALAPFAGAGVDELVAAGPIPDEARVAAPDYAALFDGTTAAPGDEARRRKFLNAAARTAVTVERLGSPGRPELRTTVTFRAHPRVPGIGRFLKAIGRAPDGVPLTATVVVPPARPETADGTLGIPFPAFTPTPGGSR